jgi:hypothetical protein
LALTPKAASTIEMRRVPPAEATDVRRGVMLTLTSVGIRIVVVTSVVTAHDNGPRVVEEMEHV